MDRNFLKDFYARRFAANNNTSRATPPPPGAALVAAATSDSAALLQRLHSSHQGLSEAQAQAVRARGGPNEIESEQPQPWYVHLWQCYGNPFNLLLTLLAIVSCLTQDLKATVVIGAMVLFSTLLRFWQEGKSNQAASALKEMVGSTATVLRAGRRSTVPARLLVPGDVIALAAGDLVPADCRLLQAKDLFVAQAAMTGESLPVEKSAVQCDRHAVNPLELRNIVFMGTDVVSGAATAMVVATGRDTYFGALAGRMTAADKTPTSFQLGVNKVSWLLIRFMLVMSPLVFLINGYTKHDWMQALLFALSVAVGLTPEMLPMIVTSTLAKGALFLSRKKVIVKHLDAIQDFGAMDVLCTDKTGTLTEDRIVLARHIDALGWESDEVLALACLNSHYQTGLNNMLDLAVLDRADADLFAAWRKVDEIPFDFERRRMSVVVSRDSASHTLITKGAVEEVLAACTHVRHGDVVEPLHGGLLARVRNVAAALNAEGLRVIAVATREHTYAHEHGQDHGCDQGHDCDRGHDRDYGYHAPAGLQRAAYGVADECGLVLAGYLAFFDPPKPSTAPALQALAARGVAVKVLTGDNGLVTASICREVGLPQQGVLSGGEVERMDDAELAQAVEQHNVFARLTPAHKERIVRLLQSNGHVVGFLGDGVNDAPALRQADVGISVDTATDIAKEAADIILLEKSLLVLEEGVLEGRRTFANMLKYIRMTASSNFGNVFSVLIASAFIPFLPMLPMQLLVQNLLYDLSQAAIPFDHVDAEQLQGPQRWDPAEIGRFMLCFGPLSSLFDVATFGAMWFLFGARTPAQQALFQSGWFIVGLLTQTLVVHLIRTPKLPFIQSRAAMPLLLLTGAVMAAGVFLAQGPLAHYFGMQALPPLYFAVLAVIVLGYMAATQAMKQVYRQAGGVRAARNTCAAGG